MKRRPVGAPALDDFTLAHVDLPDPGPDQLLVDVAYIGLEPAARPRMNEGSRYARSTEIGEAIFATGVGVVRESRSSLYRPGDAVFLYAGWRSSCVVSADAVRRIDLGRAPMTAWLGLLGLSAFTAYAGLTHIAKPKPGETVVISAASGATGAMAGQIARIMGARAVGIAGGADKCRYVVEALGFDACVDHAAADFPEALERACPDGVDVDFENVGGRVLEVVLPRMNRFGRIALCGLVAQYDAPAPSGPNLWPIVYNALTVEGFLASRYFSEIPQFIEQALTWASEGRLRQREHVYRGLEQAPGAFLDLMAGRHLGKVIVQISPDPDPNAGAIGAPWTNSTP